MPSSDERRDRLARPIGSHTSDAYRNAPREITFVLSSEMFTTLQQLAAASGQPIEGVFNGAIVLYKVSLDALREGKHVGVAERPESLETEFVGLTPSETR